jgi:hypothetical protein
LVRHLAKRAEALKQVYAREAEEEAVVAVTTLVTSLAMNFVHRGAYFPEAPPPGIEAAEPSPVAVEAHDDASAESSEQFPPAESLPPSERDELKRASR